MATDEDRYQKVRVMMWRGETVPGLSINAKLLWVYLLTSPDTTMIPGILSVKRGDKVRFTADRTKLHLFDAAGKSYRTA